MIDKCEKKVHNKKQKGVTSKITFFLELKSEMKTNSVLLREVKSFIKSFNPTTSWSIASNGTKLSQKVKKILLDFHILLSQMWDWIEIWFDGKRTTTRYLYTISRNEWMNACMYFLLKIVWKGILQKIYCYKRVKKWRNVKIGDLTFVWIFQ